MASFGSLENGLYFDELNTLRVLEPDVAKRTSELRDESKEFVEKVNDFRNLSDELIGVAERLADEVEREKLRAIGYRNSLQSLAKRRLAEKQQLEALLAEKRTQLERLRIQYESLLSVEAEQNYLIEQFLVAN